MDLFKEKEKVQEFYKWSVKFSCSMEALEILGDIIDFLREKKKFDPNCYMTNLKHLYKVSMMIIGFTDKFIIKDLIIKADLRGLFDEFITYADSLADFNQLKNYAKDSGVDIIIRALKKSRHFKEILG